MPRMHEKTTAQIEANMDVAAMVMEIDREESALKLVLRQATHHCRCAERAAERAIEEVRASEVQMHDAFCAIQKTEHRLRVIADERRKQNEILSAGGSVEDDVVAA